MPPGGNKWKGDPEAEVMASWNYSPVLSNLPLPLISLTHPGMWQVERFKVLQLKYIQSFFSITGGEEGGGGGLQRTGFLPVQWTAEWSGVMPYGRNRDWIAILLSSFYSKDPPPSFPLTSYSCLFILLSFAFFLDFPSHPLLSSQFKSSPNHVLLSPEALNHFS